MRILDGLGVASSFEEIFVSSRVGFAKPDPQIFHAALKHHELRPEQGLHVGDSEANDLHGANNAGLRGVLVDRRHTGNLKDGLRVASLSGILSLIDE
jgi:putative hydrolase of the HAD superfamily